MGRDPMPDGYKPRTQSDHRRRLRWGRFRHVPARQRLIDLALDDRVVVAFADHGSLLPNVLRKGRGRATLPCRFLQQHQMPKLPDSLERGWVGQRGASWVAKGTTFSEPDYSRLL